MAARDPHEPGRSASMLELFFDLVFVVAVSIAAVQLHHALTEGHVLDGLVTYGLVFFGIWWAWMNFTWFATSFDTDDWLYRVPTIVPMVGVLVLAADALSDERSPLTDRELDVLRAGRHGETIGQIARPLSLAPGTVRNHISTVLGKLAVDTRRQAVLLAEERGWICSASHAAGSTLLFTAIALCSFDLGLAT
ncbi:low temperature requirement protein A [Streptosporangium sp. LJ11]|uniref:low temperature requirement protein A n=1 Tax=Streptosporangium sp. LJ11 TaxID=3436927 RepID=UPI003F7A8B37